MRRSYSFVNDDWFRLWVIDDRVTREGLASPIEIVLKLPA